jgi:aldose 1-epimerase
MCVSPSAVVTALAVLLSSACVASVTSRPFGSVGGKRVTLFQLKNVNGMEADIATYGATVTRLTAPDRSGRWDDVVLGFDRIEDYPGKSPYFGCIVGRYGNRIAKGQFKIGGKTYQVPVNNGPNSLHGGKVGFDKAIWAGKVLSSGAEPAVEFTMTSPDGDQGYPGNLKVRVVYTLTKANGLRIDIEARTDKDTVTNLTNHSYFNLQGAGARDCMDHEVRIFADKIVPVSSDLIPTGSLMDVAGTPFDLRNRPPIGSRIDMTHEQLGYGRGFDHTFVVNGTFGKLRPAAEVFEPVTGRLMTVMTTEPGVQFYTGNFLDGSLVGKGGTHYPFRYGFCLETQHFPDSPNQPNFPTTLLKKGQVMRSTTVYQFSAK